VTTLRRAALVLAACLLAGGTAWAQQWSGVEVAVRRGIRDRVYPGAVVVIGRRDTILYARGFGRITWDGRAPRPDPRRTLWDLASLTKVVATTSAAMVLVDRGKLDLHSPVSRYVVEFGGAERDSVTVRMLLDHTSGLPPYARLYQQASREEALAALLTEPLERPPGAAARYSDLNAMLLGLVVENVFGASLDSAATSLVFRPLGMRDTHFKVRPAELPRTAPSRVDRGRPVAGVVNDENARRLGGVAGHAGLFSTGQDLARFAQAWLRLGAVPGGQWTSEETMRQFLERSANSGSRALGWDTPDTTTVSAFGRIAHQGEVGHTGWTGTSLWLDPASNLFLVFLTNRSLNQRAGRSLHQIRLVRAQVSDAARQVAQGSCLVASATGC
jgi:CubicO group peptidase (beta-lactamase class C family)